MTDFSPLKKLMAEATAGPIKLMDGDPLSVDFHAAVYTPKMTGATPVKKLVANAALIVAAVNALPALIARVEELEGALGIIAKGKYGTCPIDGHWPPEKPCTRCGDLGFFDTDPEYDPSRDGHCVEGGARVIARAALKGAAQ